MTDPNQVFAYIQSFLEFCLKHPYISIPVAFILLMGLVAHFFKTVKEFISFVISIQKKGTRTDKAVMWTAFGLLLALSVAAPHVAEIVTRPTPVIQTKPGKVLAKDFVVKWEYKNNDKKHATGFEVTVVEKNAENKQKVYTSKTPYILIEERGNLGIKVRATHLNWVSEMSSELVVEVYRDSIERMLAKKELVVAVHFDNRDGLFCFLNKAQEYDGFDIDLIDLIGERLKKRHKLSELNIVKQFVPWPQIIEEPNAHQVDFAIASISITPERQKAVLFSKPYLVTELALMQRKRSAGAHLVPVTLEELKGATIGVHKGTTAVDFLMKIKEAQVPSMQIKILDNNPELFAWLENDTISALAYDYVRTMAEAAARPNFIARKFEPKTFNVEPEHYGITFALLNGDLRDHVNQILINEHGTIQRKMQERRKKLKSKAM